MVEPSLSFKPPPPKPIVAVCPPSELQQRQRLFAALEEVFPLRFEPRSLNFDGVCAVISADGDGANPPADRPAYIAAAAGCGQAPPHSPRVIATAASPLLDARLRARSLREEHARVLSEIRTEPEDDVLMTLEGRPVWVARSREGVRRDIVAVELEQLGEEESLRDALRSGRFLALLPLIHFLRDVSGYHEWSRPPLHATFVFDDPNLHWTSYGFLDFLSLARHAREHGYHASMATIPLDAWLVEPRAARLFREQSRYLSLLIHGNDHSYCEFESPADPIGLLAQTLQRTEALERRAGVSVSRVLVPPHGRYSEDVLRAMPLFDLEALLSNFPPPWWYELRNELRLVGRWYPADMSLCGFPILARYDLVHPRPADELVFWSYLDQPIVLYGHHQDVAEGFERLAAEAAQVAGLANGVVWAPPRELARSCFATLLEGDVLHVRLFTRRTQILVPEEARMVSFELEATYPGSEADAVVWNGSHFPLHGSGRGLVATAPAGRVRGGDAEVVLLRAAALDAAQVRLPRPRARAVLRRTIAETRDRARPFIRRVGADALLRRAEVVSENVMRARLARRVELKGRDQS